MFYPFYSFFFLPLRNENIKMIVINLRRVHFYSDAIESIFSGRLGSANCFSDAFPAAEILLCLNLGHYLNGRK
jgi:hypothetical protein